MAAAHGARGTWRGEALDLDMKVVVLDVIRGGIIPGQTCFEMLSLVHPIEHLRLDHLNMERVAGVDGRVERVDLSGSKVGGETEGRIVIIPDPMGATGSTIRRAFGHLVETHGRPAKLPRRASDRDARVLENGSRSRRGDPDLRGPPRSGDVRAGRPGRGSGRALG